MKCVIPGINIKVFGRAVHSLSKIGDELYLEPLDHGLALRTVNSSRSAYSCFLFSPSFFHHYDDGIDSASSSDSEDSVRCKIAMKSILSVFKSLSSMEKAVERCNIHLNMKDARLVFQLHCRHGIVKTHNLAFIECETLQAVFSKDLSPNSLTASARLLCDAVMNFQNNQEEITLIVNPEKVVLKNYVDDEADPNKVMHTELCLDPDEFDNCHIGVDTDITFCLKELRAILAFSEVTNLPLTLHFETAGRPIVFSIDSDSVFEANFVLATLAEQQTRSSQVPSQARSTQKRSRPRPSQVHRSTKMTQNRHDDSRTQQQATSNSINRSKRLDRLETGCIDLTNDNDLEEMMIENNTTIHVNRPVSKETPSRGKQSVSPVASTSRDTAISSPVIPVLDTSTTQRVTTSLADVSAGGDQGNEEEEEEEEAVPGTPPAKRFRSLLFGCSQSSTQRSQKEHHTSAVLVEDTDEEDST